MVLQHPVTEEYEYSKEQITITLRAVIDLNLPAIVINPNNDAGSIGIQEGIDEYSRPLIQVHRNVPREDYAGLLKCCNILVGNSSSGLIEAPTFGVPVVNIGRRQNGRVQGANVINCNHDVNKISAAIKKGLSEKFKNTLNGMSNPYGDGSSSQKIIEILKKITIDNVLLNKELTY